MRPRSRPGAVLATSCIVGIALVAACGIGDLTVVPGDGGIVPTDGSSVPDVVLPPADADTDRDARAEDDGAAPDGDATDACTPSAEVCDGVDNDCDGTVDEGCSCAAGETAPCYTGPGSTLGVGTCKRGLSTCDATGTFGECVGQVIPGDEVCDGKDNDCDGETDEDLGSTTCGRGICFNTVTSCIGGVPQVCTPKPAQPEACNGIDDDCNGTVDDDCDCVDGQTRACYTGPNNTQNVGICRGGTATCANGRWGACANEVVPRAETCNAQDDDCDGQTDEGLGNLACGVGECSVQKPACVAGVAQVCVPGMPVAEVCDGLDNDCNGIVDNGNPGGGQGCQRPGGQGVCAAGTTACTNGALVCNQNVQSSPEVCDGLDNDCNGVVDNGNPGGGVGCATGQPGVCAPGTTACTNGAIACNSNVPSSPEVCDEKDNDCDGQIDEGNVCPP